MHLPSLPFTTTAWHSLEPTHHAGVTGTATWRTQTFGTLRVRMVEYSAGYEADHWCSKGHVLLCLHGELETELKDGTRVTLTPGMSYQVGDDVMPHKSRTRTGAVLFIVD